MRLGPAIPDGDVPYDDVAGVLTEPVHARQVRRVVLELTEGDTPIREALRRMHPDTRATSGRASVARELTQATTN